MSRWTGSSFINRSGWLQDTLSQLQDIAQGIDGTIVPFFEALADSVGTATRFLPSYSAGRPMIGLMRQLSGIISSIIQDLRNTGVYFILHHNCREIFQSVGLVNLVDETHRDNVAPAVSLIPSRPGTNQELLDEELPAETEELDSTIQLSTTLEGYEREGIIGVNRWIDDIIAAFHDSNDPHRPVVSADGHIGGFLFLFGAQNLVEETFENYEDALLHIVSALNTVFDLPELQDMEDGIRQLYSIPLHASARRREAVLSRAVQQSSYDSRGKTPDFLSVTAGRLIPALGQFLSELEGYAQYLTAMDHAMDWAKELTRTLDHRLRRIAGMFERITQFLEKMEAMSRLPGPQLLALDVESGGLQHLYDRIRQAENRPRFGPGSFIFGGGIFITNSNLYNLLKDLLFKSTDTPSLSPIYEMSPVSPFTQFRSDTLVDPDQWSVLWEGMEEELSVQAAGIMARSEILSSRLRGSPGSENPSLAATGTAQPSAYRPSEITGVASGSLGSVLGSQTLLERRSWGCYEAEVTTMKMAVPSGTTASAQAQSTRLSLHGDRRFFIAQVPFDVPRKEILSRTAVGNRPIETALLLEPRTTNFFPGSDSLESMVPSGGIFTVEERGAPTTDLLRFRSEAGPYRHYDSSGLEKTFVTRYLRGTVDFAGCSITNIYGAYTITSADLNRYVLGKQQVQVYGENHDSFFLSKILSVNEVDQSLFLETPIFTMPMAQSVVVEFGIISTPLFSRLTRTNLPLGDYLNVFSLFARTRPTAEQAEPGFSIAYRPNNVGPTHSVQHHFSWTTIPLNPPTEGFSISDGKLLVNSTSYNDVSQAGFLCLYQSTPDPVFRQVFYAKSISAVHDGIFEIGLESLSGFSREFYSQEPFDTANFVYFEDPGFFGFNRIYLEIPKTHEERTTFVPSIDSDEDLNRFLTLSHSGVQSLLRAGIVEPDGSLILVPYSAALAGVSYRMAAGQGYNGRTAIEVSPTLRETYPGRFLQVRYDIPASDGTLTLYPMVMYMGTEQGSIIRSSPTDLWRAQLESGGMTSPIPTPLDSTRDRKADRMSILAGAFNLPVSGSEGNKLVFTYYPNQRSQSLRPGRELMLLYGTEYLTLGFISVEGDPVTATLRLAVRGATFDVANISFDKGDKLEITLEIDFEPSVGVDPITFDIDKNDADYLSGTIAGTISAIDDVVLPGAKIFIGSDASGNRSCNGKIANLQLWKA